MYKPHSRIFFIDYLRGFFITIVVIQHSILAYSLSWGNKEWFYPDTLGYRSVIFDVIFLTTDSFALPMLFFVAGMFILTSLRKRGYWGFLKERFIRLGIPFIIGIPVICPLLVYPRYKLNHPDIDYISFWFSEIFFTEKIQGGPFWFLYFLFLLTLVSVFFTLIFQYFPSMKKKLMSLVRFLSQMIISKPLTSFIFFCLISFVLLGVSDLIWGPRWWIGFKKIFYVQGARFLLFVFYFFMGMLFSESKLLSNSDLLTYLSKKLPILIFFSLLCWIIYVSFSLIYLYDGAYSVEVNLFFHRGGKLLDVFPVILSEAPKVLLRNLFFSFFCVSMSVTIVIFFYQFLNKYSVVWNSLALSSYGIYLTHEPIAVWSHWFFYDKDIFSLIKAVITFILSLGLSWFFVSKVLRKLPLFKRVL